MMGRSHITLTALAWVLAAPPLTELAGRPLTVPELAASTFACAGAALWPDWDHPQATLAHTLGPATKAFARLVGKVAGGHRRRTHSLSFCVLTGAATTLLSMLPTRVAALELPANWGAMILLFALAYTAMLALGLTVSRRTGLGDGIYAVQALAVTAAAAWGAPGHWWWMPWCVGAGCLLHCLQDMLTTGGLSCFWVPFSTARARLGILGTTGGQGEVVLSTAAFGLLLWVGSATFTGHAWWTISWLMS